MPSFVAGLFSDSPLIESQGNEEHKVESRSLLFSAVVDRTTPIYSRSGECSNANEGRHFTYDKGRRISVRTGVAELTTIECVL
ncbi:MAG: hypothetical protein DMF61_12730 [Blastocatellia bacterium AA13]|nr:MAG: hypothetical protein DMF61_12730 [Blastocatellia bacterium AA13]